MEGALERLDYRVLGAATGREAVQCLSAYGPADLTVLDITLPDVDGVRLAFRILARQYTRRVLFVSDHCDDVVFLHPNLSRRVSFGGRRTPKAMLAAIQQVVPHRATTVRVRVAGQVEHLVVQPAVPAQAPVPVLGDLKPTRPAARAHDPRRAV